MKNALAIFALIFCSSLPVFAAADEQILKILQKELGSSAQFRSDKVLKFGDKLWLPFITSEKIAKAVPADSNGEISLVLRSEDDFLFSNSTLYTPIITKDEQETVKSFDFYDEQIQKKILSLKVNPNFLIPKNFVLPRDLAITAGHLPLDYARVPLATERQEAFMKKLALEKAKGLNFLSYDFSNGDLLRVRIKSVDGKSEKEIQSLNKVSEKLSMLSQMLVRDEKQYFLDFNKSKIWQLDLGQNLKSDVEAKEFLDIEGEGLQDFSISPDAKAYYALAAKSNLIYVIDAEKKKVIKEIKVPSNSFNVTYVNYSASDVDHILIGSKASSEINIYSSFDYRLTKKIKLKRGTENYMPIAYVLANKDLYVLAKDIKRGQDFKLLVYDWVSTTFRMGFDLPYQAELMKISKDKKKLFIVAKNKDSGFVLEEFDVDNNSFVQKMDIDAELGEIASLAVNERGNFLLLGSANRHVVGVVDLESFALVQKIDLPAKSHKLSIL